MTFILMMGTMIMMIDLIKEDMLKALRAKDTTKYNLLNTLYAEASIIGKNKGNRQTSDDEVIALIKKFIKNIDETCNLILGKDDKESIYEKYKKEKSILENYLPIQLDKDDFKRIIENYSFGNIPSFLSYLKENYKGKFDAKLAISIFNETIKD